MQCNARETKWPDLSHYSEAVVTQVNSVQQKECQRFKPQGFWVSVDGEDDWMEWCIGEKFRLNHLRYRHAITLHEDANILHIKTAEHLREFSDKYAIEEPQFKFRHWLRWEEIAEQYDGIIIAPYQWSLRFDNSFFWYYSWDCASGCIWEERAIKSIELTEHTISIQDRLNALREDEKSN